MTAENAAERMECMEVWGGNRFARRAVRKAGVDLWIYSKPVGDDDSGGDVYYVSSCASGRITRMLLADVSGHGLPVASIAANLRDLMRRYINFVSQTRFVSAMNRAFSTPVDQGGFATAVVSTYFAPTRSLTMSIAGHPPPFIYRSARREWHRCDEQSNPALPLGVTTEAQYGEAQISLEADDILLCYTDALIETRDADANLLGVDGLLNVVQTLDASDLDQFVDLLLEKLSAMHGDNLQTDDVTVLLVRANRLSVRWRDNLLAPVRLIGDILNRRRLDRQVQRQLP